MLTSEDESGIQTGCSVAAEMSRKQDPLHRQIDRQALLQYFHSFSFDSSLAFWSSYSPPTFSLIFILHSPVYPLFVIPVLYPSVFSFPAPLLLNHHHLWAAAYLSILAPSPTVTCPALITFPLTSHPFCRLPPPLSSSLISPLHCPNLVCMLPHSAPWLAGSTSASPPDTWLKWPMSLFERLLYK